MHLLPGQGLHIAGSTWWLPGRGRAQFGDFSSHLPRRAPRALALCGALAAELVPDLIELTRVDPLAWIVAGPDFCEISAGSAADDLFALALRLNTGGAGALFGATPLCMGVFGKQPAWRNLFGRVHRTAFQRLRDEASPLTGLRTVCRRSPFAGLAPELVEQIAFELLGLRFECTRRHESRSERAAVRARADLARLPAPQLPPQSAQLVQRYGVTDVACALLLVKLVHNMWLTSNDGNRRLAADEAALFWAAIGHPQTSPSATSERTPIVCSSLQPA